MPGTKHILLKQVDAKLEPFLAARDVPLPKNGWLSTIRSALNMSQRQLASKLGVSRQSISNLEDRETSGSATINSLKEAAQAMDLQLVYGFVPKSGSLQRYVKERALRLATDILIRTETTMALEAQPLEEQKLKAAIAELADELERDLNKALWQ